MVQSDQLLSEDSKVYALKHFQFKRVTRIIYNPLYDDEPDLLATLYQKKRLNRSSFNIRRSDYDLHDDIYIDK